MSSHEWHSEDTKIDQKPPVERPEDREGEVVQADREILNKHYLEELAFMEEPVTIRLEPSSQPNAPRFVEVWVNGIGAEMLIRGKWVSVTWLPVAEAITIKRKYLEVIVRNKIDRITTAHDEAGSSEFINNRVIRNTSAVQSFSVIEDKHPYGATWLTELRRRNF